MTEPCTERRLMATRQCGGEAWREAPAFRGLPAEGGIKQQDFASAKSCLRARLDRSKKVEKLDGVIIRFAGDSGDGMQLTGDRFTSETATLGNDLATFPDFPAEIRAPAGSLPGVSGFQVHFADHDILTAGDRPDVLVVMNPAALRTNIGDLPKGGTVIVDADAFGDRTLQKAGYAANPIEDGSLGRLPRPRGAAHVDDRRCPQGGRAGSPRARRSGRRTSSRSA